VLGGRIGANAQKAFTVNPLRLGTRGSQLALFQATLVARRIESACARTCEIVVIKTAGDRLQQAPLSEIGGKRLFVKEIEDALIRGDIDLAVHSSKDMPAVLPDGLDIGAVLEREDPRDAIVNRPSSIDRRSSIDDLQSLVGSRRIGTGSVRRIAQLRSVFPAASFEDIRGNLDTRLRKLDSGDYDLLVLAAAGLRRLGFGARISALLPFEVSIPAPGQGIIAVEIRADDASTRSDIGGISDPVTRAALEAERALVTAVGGGCQMPLGAIAVPVGRNDLELTALVSTLDGSRVIRYKKVGTQTDALALGRDVADELLRQGASDILAAVKQYEPRIPDPESRRLT
jgi:hydroxymethylbilane synthase